MIYLHIGAGPADLDEKTNFRCGFTEFIKKNYKHEDKIFLVEANPLNISKLKKSYENYNNVFIFNLGISDKCDGDIEFYFTEDDKPNYPICSLKYEHVKKHYPNSTISKMLVKTLNINNFLEKCVAQKEIDYLSIDIEGVDFDVLMSIDFTKYNIKNISFEFIHFSRNQKKKIIQYLSSKGYSYCGFGFDHENYDLLFKKKIILTNRLLSKFFWLIGRKHRNFFNKFIFND